MNNKKRKLEPDVQAKRHNFAKELEGFMKELKLETSTDKEPIDMDFESFRNGKR